MSDAVLTQILTKLDRADARDDALNAKLDALRAESATRGKETEARFGKLDANVTALGGEVRNLGTRMLTAEEEIRKLRDADTDAKRNHSDSDLKHESEMAAVIVSVARLENATRERHDELGNAITELRRNDAAQNETLRTIASQGMAIVSASASADKKMAKLTHWTQHPALRAIAVVIGTAVGAAAAQYLASRPQSPNQQTTPTQPPPH